MKTEISSYSISAYILIFLLCLGVSASFGQDPASTPEPRPRVVVSDPVTATPSPTPIPAKTQATLAELRAKIASRVSRPEVRRGTVGFKAVSLRTGKVIFEQNAEKYLMPASNMKNFTVATAIERLSPDFRFITSVYADAMPSADGKLSGNVRIYGRGDLSFSTSFWQDDFYKRLDDLAAAIANAGVKRIDGDLIGDDTYFTGSALPYGWEWDDLQWYYGAEVSALPLNDNTLTLRVKPGPSGYPCSVSFEPDIAFFQVKNLCTTTAAGQPRTLTITKGLERNELVIAGTLPVGNGGFFNNITVSRPAELFVKLLKERLALKGITVKGKTRAIDRNAPPQAGNSVEIAKLESPPLFIIAQKTMKPSQNMYTEVLLRTLGEDLRKKMLTNSPVRADSQELGLQAVKEFMRSIGIADDAFIQYDGSGLSRHDLVTNEAIVRLYVYMGKESKYSQAWRDALTIAGVDGTLKNRFSGTKGSGNVRGKTGTIDQVSALSGYLTTAGGEEVAFSALVNGVAQPGVRTSLIDDVVLYLVNFDGKID
jgi:D-alanyl-D-alanine carboxypeptidase/D-alanyl-D-alanine-endopeptidase (penicillin-binding protein 4)